VQVHVAPEGNVTQKAQPSVQVHVAPEGNVTQKAQPSVQVHVAPEGNVTQKAQPSAKLGDMTKGMPPNSSASGALAELPGKIASILVLINKGQDASRQKHLNTTISRMTEELPAMLKVEPVDGLNARAFDSEGALESQQEILMSDSDKVDWKKLTRPSFGIRDDTYPDPSLACSLGHKRMWEIVANRTEGTWTVLLEDDVEPREGFNLSMQQSLKEASKAGADVVLLEDTHCKKYGPGYHDSNSVHTFIGVSSAAYAVTPKGAKALLTRPFQYHTDRMLNAVVQHGLVKGLWCPHEPSFTVQYQHRSQIGDMLMRMRETNILLRASPPHTPI